MNENRVIPKNELANNRSDKKYYIINIGIIISFIITILNICIRINIKNYKLSKIDCVSFSNRFISQCDPRYIYQNISIISPIIDDILLFLLLILIFWIISKFFIYKRANRLPDGR